MAKVKTCGQVDAPETDGGGKVSTLTLPFRSMVVEAKKPKGFICISVLACWLACLSIKPKVDMK